VEQNARVTAGHAVVANGGSGGKVGRYAWNTVLVDLRDQGAHGGRPSCGQRAGGAVGVLDRKYDARAGQRIALRRSGASTPGLPHPLTDRQRAPLSLCCTEPPASPTLDDVSLAKYKLVDGRTGRR